MFKQVLIPLAIVAVLAFGSCQAQDNGDDEEFDMLPPRGRAPMPPHQGHRGPTGGFHQGQAAFQPVDPSQMYQPEQEQQLINEFQNQQPAGSAQQQKLRQRFGSHLRDFARGTHQGSKQMFREASPAMQNIKADFGELGNRIKSHPTVVNGMIRAKPKIEALKKHSQPLVNKVGSFTSKAAHRLAERRQRPGNQRPSAGPHEPGSVYPMPPAGVDYEQAPPAYQ